MDGKIYRINEEVEEVGGKIIKLWRRRENDKNCGEGGGGK